MATTRRIIWSPAAAQDLGSVWRYYSKAASPDVADELVRKIHLAVTRLGARPLLGRAREELAPGIRSLLAHPYAVFYRAQEDRIEIVRILHEHRDFAAALSGEKS